MIQAQLSPLILNEWVATRDTLHQYCRMIGKIRENMSPPNPHWWHISMRVSEKGLTTTPIPKSKDSTGQTFEIIFDLVNHHLVIESNFREVKRIKLTGQSICALYEETCSLLTEIGVVLPIGKDLFDSGKSGVYDEEAVTGFWYSLKEIDRILNLFRSGLSGSRSPVQLWPHHFDMSMSWFSGRLVPGKDPNNVDASKEQIMFGFSTGDKNIPDAYFYVLSYPILEELSYIKLPDDTKWNTAGFQGGVMMYDAFNNSDNPEVKLLNFYETFFRTGSFLMRQV